MGWQSEWFFCRSFPKPLIWLQLRDDLTAFGGCKIASPACLVRVLAVIRGYIDSPGIVHSMGSQCSTITKVEAAEPLTLQNRKGFRLVYCLRHRFKVVENRDPALDGKSGSSHCKGAWIRDQGFTGAIITMICHSCCVWRLFTQFYILLFMRILDRNMWLALVPSFLYLS